MNLNLNDYDFVLPQRLIATSPVEPRDQARLLCLDKTNGSLTHRHFFELVELLQDGDLLVVNDSKVIPARLVGRKVSGGAVEVLLSRNLGDPWECLVKGKVKPGELITFSEKLRATVALAAAGADKVKVLKFNLNGSAFMAEVDRIGQVPLPPYIVKARHHTPPGGVSKFNDASDYQTVYAAINHSGSVAAPTAGLHFTDQLLTKLKAKGVRIAKVTLHVGLGTFLPLTEAQLSSGKLHQEWAEIPPETVAAIVETKKKNGRVVAVGTTSTRTLEFFAPQILAGLDDCRGWVDLFIRPPYDFKIIDGLITNFHLPQSSLLLLVAALAGRKHLLAAYAEAIKQGYRFYSYGDAMLII